MLSYVPVHKTLMKSFMEFVLFYAVSGIFRFILIMVAFLLGSQEDVALSIMFMVIIETVNIIVVDKKNRKAELAS